MRHLRSLPLYVLCLASVSAWTRSAMPAPPDPADVLFTEGVADMEAKLFDEGCPKLDKSYRLNPRPGTLFALADCEAARGRIATAVAYYNEYLALYDTLTPDKMAKQGTRQKDSLAQKSALEPQVPLLTLVLPRDPPRGLVVKQDGTEIPSKELGSALPVDPGQHVITTQLPDGPVWEARVALEKGQTQQLQLQVKERPPSQPQPGSRSTWLTTPELRPDQPTGAREPFFHWYKRKPVAWVGTGVTGVGLVLGITFSALSTTAVSKANSDVDQIKAQDAKHPEFNPGHVTNICGDKSTGVGALPHYVAACATLRNDISDHSRDIAGAAVGWTLFGLGAVGTAVYAMVDWYPKKQGPETTGKAFAPHVVALMPIIAPSQQGLGLVGTF